MFEKYVQKRERMFIVRTRNEHDGELSKDMVYKTCKHVIDRELVKLLLCIIFLSISLGFTYLTNNNTGLALSTFVILLAVISFVMGLRLAIKYIPRLVADSLALFNFI